MTLPAAPKKLGRPKIERPVDWQPIPDCWFSRGDWIEWQKLAAEARHRPEICADCLPWWRDAMVAAGRCAHPETVFVRAADDPDDIYGLNCRDRGWETVVTGHYRSNHKAKPSLGTAERLADPGMLFLRE